MSWLIYFLKIMVIQLAAYLGYKLLLDNERAGHFKRFYLLVSLTLAYVVPFIFISRITDVVPVVQLPEVTVVPTQGMALLQSVGYVEVSFFTISSALMVLVYLAGVAYHLNRTIRQLLAIRKQITTNPTVELSDLTLVLVPETVSPHSFFHWCFYSATTPPNAMIMEHEAAHARQLHSLDRLLVVFLKTFCWFNPVHLLFEQAIIVNHELLADQAVLRSGYDPIAYQTALLTTLRATSVAGPLVSGAGFLLTKKRFTMMNSTSGNRFVSASKFLAVLSLWGILLFSFGQTGYTQIAPPPPPTSPPGPPPPPPPPPVPGPMKILVPTASNLAAWQDAETYGVWIDGERVENSVLANYSADDFGHYFKAKLTPTAINYGKHVYQLELMTKAAFEKYQSQMAKDGKPIPPPPPPAPAGPPAPTPPPSPNKY